MKNGIEFGPGKYPAINYFKKHGVSQVTFVVESEDPSRNLDYGILWPGCIVSTLGLVDFVSKVAIPNGNTFERVVVCNVLNDPGTKLRIANLGLAVSQILSPNGILHLENTIDQVEQKFVDQYVAGLTRFGFATSVYYSNDLAMFVNPSLPKANGDGFCIEARLV